MSCCVRLFRPGLLAYEAAVEWQARAALSVREGAAEALALLEHPPVYTLGRRGRRDSLLREPSLLLARGAAVVASDRGGDVTFHGPGQVVVYPVLDLRRRGLGAIDYVRHLEGVMIGAMSRFGLNATRVSGWPGVWLDGAKLGAVGVRVRGGVTTHGFALNVDPDLSWFDAIVPCGLTGIRVTSMAAALGQAPDADAVESALLDAFAATFDAELVPWAVATHSLVAAHG